MIETTSERMTITVEEMANMLGIGRNLAYELIKEKQIQSVRAGRKILIPRAAVRRWLEGESK